MKIVMMFLSMMMKYLTVASHKKRKDKQFCVRGEILIDEVEKKLVKKNIATYSITGTRIKKEKTQFVSTMNQRYFLFNNIHLINIC